MPEAHVLFALILVSWVGYAVRPARKLDIAVLDKTVPYRNRIEHRSFFWLLRHLKVQRPDGGWYDPDSDYLGAFPGPTPGDPPERTVDLAAERAARADLVYLADAYGVYREDLESGPPMKAALERSPRIYGGLQPAEAEAAIGALRSGKTLVAEFNTLGSPTGSVARIAMERTLGIKGTRWIGRFFQHLDDREEVPEWMRRDYEREWKRPWEFTGAGYVLVQDDAKCEVLRAGPEVSQVGLTLDRETPIDPLLSRARDGIAYPYWIEYVQVQPGTRVLASFHWHVTEAGAERLEARGLPQSWAAVTRRTAPGSGPAYYFAGDFADNPMPDTVVPFAGYLTIRGWVESKKLSPSESSFYWSFYAPMLARILQDVPPGSGQASR